MINFQCTKRSGVSDFVHVLRLTTSLAAGLPIHLQPVPVHPLPARPGPDECGAVRRRVLVHCDQLHATRGLRRGQASRVGWTGRRSAVEVGRGRASVVAGGPVCPRPRVHASLDVADRRGRGLGCQDGGLAVVATEDRLMIGLGGGMQTLRCALGHAILRVSLYPSLSLLLD
mmetsp:Transcript_74116/g.197607  ORF Transcript_74116/g.197607 Transcript_74116/m.197607 type:complete len:172 (-) Transcript_74116:292-807(-)